MAPRNLKRLAPPLPENVRQLLAQGLTQYQTPEAVIFKGRETLPLISLRTPAHGRINKHGAKIVGECAKKRQLSTLAPGALLRLKSPVAGYMVFEPVAKFDETVPELYELMWNRGNHEARINLLGAMQPINMEVPKGYVTEIQMTMEVIGGQYYLLLHLHHPHTRAIQQEDEEEAEQTAGARAEETTE